MHTIFEKSQAGQHAYSLPKNDPAFQGYQPPQNLVRQTRLPLPEISELDLTRHYSRLAQHNIGIDTQFYPLGSCTMKFNPRVNEWCAGLPGFRQLHPLAPEETVQGNLQVMDELLQMLMQVCGMTAGSLLPCAGAHGEFTGVKMIAAYHRQRNDLKRDEMLIPDSAHGTNPATAAMAGFKTITIKTDASGDLDLEDLKAHLSERTAGLMMTNPTTLGLFSPQIMTISRLVHESGGLLYYDGANLNAIMNVARPGDMGFDVMHLNLHKTFSTPHGGGGPGAGPVLCNDKLADFLPVPRLISTPGGYRMEWSHASSIGQITSFYGNFCIYLRAYLYALLHGNYGLRRIATMAVLNANYLKAKIAPLFTVPYPQACMHEFVVQADRFMPGIRAFDIAKRLLDYGVHAPTIYFPLIVKECLLIEPTESESQATLDVFVAALASIVEEAKNNPELVTSAPHRTPLRRLNEVQAAKNPRLKHETT